MSGVRVLVLLTYAQQQRHTKHSLCWTSSGTQPKTNPAVAPPHMCPCRSVFSTGTHPSVAPGAVGLNAVQRRVSAAAGAGSIGTAVCHLVSHCQQPGRVGNPCVLTPALSVPVSSPRSACGYQRRTGWTQQRSCRRRASRQQPCCTQRCRD